MVSAGTGQAVPAAKQGFRLGRRQRIGILLGLIVLLGAFLRFYQLGTYSIGNRYYAATVQSMLTSWHNFFFASFEPGGSVTVDKPPAGFWLQAASAYVLGVSGFALALPQALAGVLSIPLLYALVRRPFGESAGLVAALALAVTPIAVATERNNTIDGLLLFVLLLATWAFLRALRSGRLSYLLLGTFLVGVGFNIKMLQAWMSLPALYAVYLLGARHPLWKRLAYLAIATVVLLAVSLSWAVAVDLTPPENRPYIGSSNDNTVMELIVGHNGLRRLGLLAGGGPRPGGAGGPQPPSAGQAAGPPRAPGGLPVPLPASAGGQPGNPASLPAPGGPAEMGTPGVLRLFSEPLSDEASWLLPLVLLGLPILVAVLGWKWPLAEQHLALVLWAGWLLPELAYFSLNPGLMHTYYLTMLGPPLAALAGATVWALGQALHRWLVPAWGLVALLTGLTLAFQLHVLRNYPAHRVVVEAIAVPLLALGLGLLVVAGIAQKGVSRAALGVALAAVLVAPLLWSALTALNPIPDVGLPHAGPGTAGLSRPAGPDGAQQRLLAYMLAETEPGSYLLATLNANQAAPLILATKRPVLTLGGFTGSDRVVDVDRLARMVFSGELRFVLGEGLEQQKPAIGEWVKRNCTVVQLPGLAPFAPAAAPGRPEGAVILYDCQPGAEQGGSD